jgi:hypothetical protein
MPAVSAFHFDSAVVLPAPDRDRVSAARADEAGVSGVVAGGCGFHSGRIVAAVRLAVTLVSGDVARAATDWRHRNRGTRAPGAFARRSERCPIVYAELRRASALLRALSEGRGVDVGGAASARELAGDPTRVALCAGPQRGAVTNNRSSRSSATSCGQVRARRASNRQPLDARRPSKGELSRRLEVCLRLETTVLRGNPEMVTGRRPNAAPNLYHFNPSQSPNPTSATQNGAKTSKSPDSGPAP